MTPPAMNPATPPPATPTPGSRRLAWWPQFPSTRQLSFCLLAITALGALLRFFRISYQCYWTDESYTVNRVHDSFDFMLAMLTDQGFPPGWYVLLRWWTNFIQWLISPGHWWTNLFGAASHPEITAIMPLATRSLTALLGTLTIPAMYFLARQFTDRKGALLVALLTAVNPYLVYYSRDIKMYQPTWFFLILNIAIFFKWQTTHKHLVWFPLYVITGFCMTAMHSTAWFIVALQFLFLLTRPRLRSLDGALWTLGVGLMSLLPIYWYNHRSRWFDRVIEREGNTGLSWVTNYTDMSWETIQSLPCSHLLGYLWPSYPPSNYVRGWFGIAEFDKHQATRGIPWLASAEMWVALGFAAILILGLFPWRWLRTSDERQNSVTRHRWWWLAIWLVLPTAALALTWIPKDSPWYKCVWHDLDKVSPLWEPRYLGVILPALILWLAASLRRLPTWPVRTLAILLVLSASLASACSNYFVYRNLPFHEAAAVAAKHLDPQNRKSMAIGHTGLGTPGVVVPVTYAMVDHVRPKGDYRRYWYLPPDRFHYGLYDNNSTYQFLRTMRTTPEIQKIVLTDKYGDLTAPQEPLSDESIARMLGPCWKLAESKSYRIYFEWRFYVLKTWRTRVWQRVPLQASTTPATAPESPKNPL